MIKGWDQRGHIIGAQLGGKGEAATNLFAQEYQWHDLWTEEYEADVYKAFKNRNQPPCKEEMRYLMFLYYRKSGPLLLRPHTYEGFAFFDDNKFLESGIYENPLH